MDLVGPRPLPGRLVHAYEEIRVADPLSSGDAGLVDDLSARAHRLQRASGALCDGGPVVLDRDDVTTLGDKAVQDRVLVALPAVEQQL
jgi:hypothetical protein